MSSILVIILGLNAWSQSKKSKSSNSASNIGINEDNIKKVFVKGGTYIMGKGELAHQESVNSFEISKYEITNAQYAAFLNAKRIGPGINGEGNKLFGIISDGLQLEFMGAKWKAKSGFENFPMIYVTWFGASKFCEWVGGRLPTEAEWEYAAKGGQKSKGFQYAGSNDIDKIAWFFGNSKRQTHAVGTKKPNELKIYDMSGNVWEWCSDLWSESYTSDSRGFKTEASNLESRIFRGGSWDSDPNACSVTHVANFYPQSTFGFVGFRPIFPMK